MTKCLVHFVSCPLRSQVHFLYNRSIKLCEMSHYNMSLNCFSFVYYVFIEKVIYNETWLAYLQSNVNNKNEYYMYM